MTTVRARDGLPRIRRGVAADVPSVLALWRQAAAVATVTDTAEGLHRLLRFDPGALLVADEGGRLAGSVVAAWNGWRGTIYRLAVQPGLRRRGLAAALVEAGEDRLRRCGAQRIDAIVDTEEPAAVAFWGASPYTRQKHRARFVRNLTPP